ncbi:MAG: hypothetical protein HY917_02790, partial [Candidatus Diapherotrites archaeon]|nr:hypothetical protein [Candidatus Diapherotrites archaeon]
MVSFSFFRSALKSFALRVLDVDETRLPVHQLQLLEDFKRNWSLSAPSRLQDFIAYLSQKHLVDSITVAAPDGTLLAASNGHGLKDLRLGRELFRFV